MSTQVMAGTARVSFRAHTVTLGRGQQMPLATTRLPEAAPLSRTTCLAIFRPVGHAGRPAGW